MVMTASCAGVTVKPAPLIAGSGTGGFAGATGRLDLKDEAATGLYFYRAHITLGERRSVARPGSGSVTGAPSQTACATSGVPGLEVGDLPPGPRTSGDAARQREALRVARTPLDGDEVRVDAQRLHQVRP